MAEVEEQVHEKQGPRRLGAARAQLRPWIQAHEAGPSLPKVSRERRRRLRAAAAGHRPRCPLEGEQKEAPEHLPDRRPQERPHDVEVHLLELLLLVADRHCSRQPRNDVERIHHGEDDERHVDDRPVRVPDWRQAACAARRCQGDRVPRARHAGVQGLAGDVQTLAEGVGRALELDDNAYDTREEDEEYGDVLRGVEPRPQVAQGEQSGPNHQGVPQRG
mmetsp:Transcript_109041/g.303222  ORF Transcript_109041/g.303222 Transcript_109041/m.303222 type:complete len:219 (-) Transcript_109041:179-835(-)